MINLIQSHNIILVNITSRSDLWTLHRSRDKWRRDRNTCRPGLWRACASREPISWRDFFKNLKTKIGNFVPCPLNTGGKWFGLGVCLEPQANWERATQWVNHWWNKKLHLNGVKVYFLCNYQWMTHWLALSHLVCRSSHTPRPNHFPLWSRDKGTKLPKFCI